MKKSVLMWCLVFMLVGVIIIQDIQYKDMVKVCDDLEVVLEKERADHDKLIGSWEESYDKLQSDYGSLLVKNDKLKEKVSKLKEKLNARGVKEYSVSASDIELLVKVCKCEAGEKNYAAQRGVCSVILNRVKSGQFPNSVSAVVYQKSDNVPQFSVAYNGMLDKCSVDDESLLQVYRVIVKGSSLPDYVLYFYDESIDYQSWVLTLNKYDMVEGTVFAYERRD